MPGVPPLLAPYLSLRDDGSITLLTSTLGASSSWLVASLLTANQSTRFVESLDEQVMKNSHVLLLSWLHDKSFWKDVGRKLSIDFRRIHIIDALSSGLGLDADSLEPVEEEIRNAILRTRQEANDCRTLLVLDGLDFLLAATACRVQQLLDLIYDLRDGVDHMVITAHADAPLLQVNNTPLEASNSAFTMSIAHSARLVMSVKPLDTGGAEDVSGVLRITTGGDRPAPFREGERSMDRELLYFIGADGGAEVFERGSRG